MELTGDAVEFQADSPAIQADRRQRTSPDRGDGDPEVGRAGDPAPGRALGVDEAALAALDPLVAAGEPGAADRHRRARLHRLRDPLAPPQRGDRHDFHPLKANLAGVNFAQLAIGVLGVLAITAEYSTGMIRSTICAVPKRLPVLWGKALVFAAVAFAVSLPAIFIVFFVGQAILAGPADRHRHLPPGGAAGAVRRRPVPDRDGPLRPRPRRDHPQHRRRDRRPRRESSSSCRRSSACCRPASPTRSNPICRAAPATRSGRSTPIRTRSPPGRASASSAPTPRWRSRSPRC